MAKTYKDKVRELLETAEYTKSDAEDVRKRIEAQIPKHRDRLFLLIASLTVASFVLLVFVVLFQMFWKIRHPEYTVVSDTVINVLAVGVFAELVGVVGIVAKLLWQK